jgi:hypothetical protein
MIILPLYQDKHLELKFAVFVSQQEPKFESKTYVTSCWLHYYGLRFVPEDYNPVRALQYL